jgi:pilus assembly protein CpaE
MEIGIIDLLRIPFSEDNLKKAVSKALKSETQKAHENVLAFLPAKAGSGATTTAMNSAVALARHWERKVLLIEVDLHSGLLPVLLKLDPKQSIIDALENSDSLDEARWRQLITKAEGIDILPTPWGKPTVRFTPWEYHRLLAFASPRYDVVVVDLPEVINDATEAIVTRASCVQIVCTAESSSVFLARRRIHELEARSVRPDRVRVVLNRSVEQGAVAEIELLLGRKLFWVLPNDYQQVRAATSTGRSVEPASSLGQAYRRFAADLVGIEAPPEPAEGSGSPQGSGDSQDHHSMMDKLRKTLDKLRGEDAVKRPT